MKANQTVPKEVQGRVNAWLYNQLGAKPGEIRTQEDLKNFRFLCKGCFKVKSAIELVLVTFPIMFENNPLNARPIMSQRVGIVCKECANRMSKGDVATDVIH